MRRQTNGESRTAFAWEFLRNPRTVAAVTPSGDPLADMVTAPIPTTGTPVVVELGPRHRGIHQSHPAPARRSRQSPGHRDQHPVRRAAGRPLPARGRGGGRRPQLARGARRPRPRTRGRDRERAALDGVHTHPRRRPAQRRLRHALPTRRVHHVHLHAYPVGPARPAAETFPALRVRGGRTGPDGVGKSATGVRLLLPPAAHRCPARAVNHEGRHGTTPRESGSAAQPVLTALTPARAPAGHPHHWPARPPSTCADCSTSASTPTATAGACTPFDPTRMPPHLCGSARRVASQARPAGEAGPAGA
jgi:hypothetical protein